MCRVAQKKRRPTPPPKNGPSGKKSDESERLWRNALERDFSFPSSDGVEHHLPGSSSHPLSLSLVGAERTHHLRTLRVSEEVLDRYRRVTRGTDHDAEEDDGASHGGGGDAMGCKKSVFGYSASEGVCDATCAFESWKQWKMVSKIYYRTMPPDDGDDGERFGTIDPSVLGKNVNGPYFLRAADLWSKIERWCRSPPSSTLGPSILRSLHPGASHHASRFSDLRLKRLQNNLDSSGLNALEAVYAFHDGHSSNGCPFHGLVGGYSAYNEITVTHLLDPPTADAVYRLEGAVDYSHAEYYPVAANVFRNHKCFEVRIATGEMVVEDKGYERSPALYHVRDGAVRPGGGVTGTGKGKDEALVWMEEFARRLSSGDIVPNRVGVGEQTVEVLSLYPTVAAESRVGGHPDPVPVVSRAVTRGVEVVASGVFAHDMGCHVYSIRIRLLTEDEEGGGRAGVPPRGFETCQLASRNWSIRNHVSGELDEVTGDGVVGMYPLLNAGGGYRNDTGNSATSVRAGDMETTVFRYQSCCGPTQGSFRGKIKFVPGSLRAPQGDPFWVELAPFALDLTPRAIF